MPFWDRLFNPKTVIGGRSPHRELVESVGLLLLAAREKRDDSLRNSPRLAELLELLWHQDDVSLDAVREALGSVEKVSRDVIATLARRVREASSSPPSSPEAVYEAVVALLHEDLAAGRPYPLPFGQLTITQETGMRLVHAVTLARILLPAELHEPVCDALVTNSHALQDGITAEARFPYQHLLRNQIHRYLVAFSPQAIPHFWRMAAQEDTSEEFWPVLGRIRDRNAVPYLLELIPRADYPVESGFWNVGGMRQTEDGHRPLAFGGQWEIIAALTEIADVRAVPVLQAMAQRSDYARYHVIKGFEILDRQRENNRLAEQAGLSVRTILRNAQDGSADLLRLAAPPEDAQTLLRPVVPAASTTATGELLRPSDEP